MSTGGLCCFRAALFSVFWQRHRTTWRETFLFSSHYFIIFAIRRIDVSALGGNRALDLLVERGLQFLIAIVLALFPGFIIGSVLERLFLLFACENFLDRVQLFPAEKVALCIIFHLIAGQDGPFRSREGEWLWTSTVFWKVC